MFIADMYQNIRDTEEYELTEELIEKLDKMLTENGIEHFFSLPRNEDIDADETVSLTVAYEREKETAFFLVYALWCKVYRHADDALIQKAMLKHVAEK